MPIAASLFSFVMRCLGMFLYMYFTDLTDDVFIYVELFIFIVFMVFLFVVVVFVVFLVFSTAVAVVMCFVLSVVEVLLFNVTMFGVY